MYGNKLISARARSFSRRLTRYWLSIDSHQHSTGATSYGSCVPSTQAQAVRFASKDTPIDNAESCTTPAAVARTMPSLRGAPGPAAVRRFRH